MKLVCCVKHVPDTNTQIQLTADKKDIVRESVNYVMSPYDEFGVEEALRIKEKNAGSTVTVITLGPERSDQALRTGLAMGADDAIHLLDEKNAVTDPLVTAKCLAKALKDGGFDIIFCGRQAVDDDAFQVGSALASLLNIGCVVLASKVTVDAAQKKVTVEKVMEGGIRQTISGSFPVVITAQKGLNEPRFASLPGIMKAKSKPVTKKKIEELGVDISPRLVLESMELSNYVRRKHIISSDHNKEEAVTELLRLLKTEAKVLD